MSVPPPIPVQRANSSMAIVSLIFGVLAWLAIPLIGAVVAVITGHLARSEIRASGGKLDGDGMAVAGLILGWLQLFLTVCFILIVMLFLGGLAFFAAHS